ncbi:Low-affinity glucose transporter [Psilocybe cubensis]|uniref:Low-affinity glucose transporter n=1 Tax=Psilocybe cubensis TaxID=181762 RepID=A0ACB8HFH6_PSICU|nr:Low-affinity glucose transporter [Psilocybe cubensis]KAH9486467.1 Low-affinity glucose transporter [Psilocybe cubensis]
MFINPLDAGFLFGYDIGVISGCLIMPDFIRRFGELDDQGKFFLSSSRQSIITSLLSAGGALAQAFTSDRNGRRGSILIWSAVFTIGVAIQTGTTFSIVQLTIGRFIAGLGVGALSVYTTDVKADQAISLYNSETAPKALRGAMLVLYQLQIIIGIFLSYILDLATHSISNSASWRIPVGLQLLLGLILLSGIFFLPESPRHLLGTGRHKEARGVIAALNGVPEDDELVDELVAELDYAIRQENDGGKATWAECFSARNNLWKRTGNGMMLQFIQQLNGQNFYYYYGDTFFQSAGTQLNPFVIQVILGGVSVIGTIPALRLIETWGRRRSLLTGALLEAACALIAGLVGHFTLAPPGTPQDQLTTRNRRGGDTLIAFAVLHLFSFSIFWGPTPPKSIALGSATNWLWNFLLSFFSPRISARIGPLILLIFFGMLLFGYVYVYLFVPETKGLTLEEVDEMYRSGVKPWNSPSWQPSLSREAHEKALKELHHEKRESPELAA